MPDAVEWYQIQARGASRDLWVTFMWEGKPQYGPWLMPDGRHIDELIFEGMADQVPFPVWFKPSDSGNRLRNLLWTGGNGPIASAALVAALESIEATGYRTYDIDLRDRKGNPIPGYAGFLPTSITDDTDVRCFSERSFMSFRARPHVVEALKAHGITDIDVKPYVDHSDPLHVL